MRVTTASICGSDLHVLHGLMPKMEPGSIIGHEFVGVVDAVGIGGRRASSRATGWWGRRPCGAAGAAPAGKGCSAPASAGPSSATARCSATSTGAQADYVRVPFADVTLQPIPDGLSDEQVIFAGDILPTGYSAVAGLAPGGRGVRPGDTVVIFGAGPVGLCAVASARLFDPARIIVVDMEAVPPRAWPAGWAPTWSSTPRDRGRPQGWSRKLTDGWGADYVVEAVGKQETLGERRAPWRPRAARSPWWACSSSRYPINAPRMLAKNLTLTIGMGDLGPHARNWST